MQSFALSTIYIYILWKWLINCVAMGRARFLLCTGFFFFFSFFADKTQTSSWPNFESCNLWSLFAKSCWNINTRTMLQILFSLLCVKYIFFWFYRSVPKDLKGIIITLKKGITSAMECTDVAAFTFATWQIRSCLLCKLILAEATVINLFAILQVFLVGFGKWGEFFGCFLVVS